MKGRKQAYKGLRIVKANKIILKKLLPMRLLVVGLRVSPKFDFLATIYIRNYF